MFCDSNNYKQDASHLYLIIIPSIATKDLYNTYQKIKIEYSIHIIDNYIIVLIFFYGNIV